MNKSTKFFFNIILYTLPLFAWADQYPINKNIDIKHYVFQLRLTDSNDEIIGTTQVTKHIPGYNGFLPKSDFNAHA